MKTINEKLEEFENKFSRVNRQTGKKEPKWFFPETTKVKDVSDFIRTALTEQQNEFKKTLNSGKKMFELGRKELLDELEKELPKEATESDGWEALEGKSCCPGDDWAYGFNNFRDKVKQLIANKRR